MEGLEGNAKFLHGSYGSIGVMYKGVYLLGNVFFCAFSFIEVQVLSTKKSVCNAYLKILEGLELNALFLCSTLIMCFVVILICSNIPIYF